MEAQSKISNKCKNLNNIKTCDSGHAKEHSLLYNIHELKPKTTPKLKDKAKTGTDRFSLGQKHSFELTSEFTGLS